nr:hypothetical protein CFP56_37254 [Quercus suber]
MTFSTSRDSLYGNGDGMSNVAQSPDGDGAMKHSLANPMLQSSGFPAAGKLDGEDIPLRTIVENVSLEAPIVAKSNDVRSWQQSERRRQKRKWFSQDSGRVSVRRRSWTSSEKFSSPSSPSRYLSSEEDTRTLPRAAIPPFAPPERVRTPVGLPRWPSDLRQDQRITTSKWQAILAFARNGSSTELSFRSIFGGVGSHEPLPASPGRSWRPPLSGHSTHRFADLTSHPFISSPDTQV